MSADKLPADIEHAMTWIAQGNTDDARAVFNQHETTSVAVPVQRFYSGFITNLAATLQGSVVRQVSLNVKIEDAEDVEILGALAGSPITCLQIHKLVSYMGDDPDADQVINGLCGALREIGVRELVIHEMSLLSPDTMDDIQQFSALADTGVTTLHIDSCWLNSESLANLLTVLGNTHITELKIGNVWGIDVAEGLAPIAQTDITVLSLSGNNNKDQLTRGINTAAKLQDLASVLTHSKVRELDLSGHGIYAPSAIQALAALSAAGVQQVEIGSDLLNISYAPSRQALEDVLANVPDLHITIGGKPLEEVLHPAVTVAAHAGGHLPGQDMPSVTDPRRYV